MIDIRKAIKEALPGDNTVDVPTFYFASSEVLNAAVKVAEKLLAEKDAEIERLKGVAHGFVDEIGERDQRIADAQDIAHEMRSQLVDGPELHDVVRIIDALRAGGELQ